jgi:hypothetical protein
MSLDKSFLPIVAKKHRRGHAEIPIVLYAIVA